MTMMMTRGRVDEYLEFVNRLPLTKEQKKEFVKNHIEILKKQKEEEKDNKLYFSNEVLPSIRAINDELPPLPPVLRRS